MMTNFGGNRYFGVVLCFGLFWMFLLYGWACYGFMILGDSIALPWCMNF